MSTIHKVETITWYTEEEADNAAYWWSKGLEAEVENPSEERRKIWEPTYCTSLKEVAKEGEDPFEEYCWFVTNKFDPRADRSAYSK